MVLYYIILIEFTLIDRIIEDDLLVMVNVASLLNEFVLYSIFAHLISVIEISFLLFIFEIKLIK